MSKKLEELYKKTRTACRMEYEFTYNNCLCTILQKATNRFHWEASGKSGWAKNLNEATRKAKAAASESLEKISEGRE
jgi:ribosomal protein S11